MIDFISTRTSTDPQTAACARLLTAVITQAIQDACTPMTTEERKQKKNLNTNARRAIRFLFGADSVFPLYAELIGVSHEAIRFALLNKAAEPQIAKKPLFTDADRRAIRVRLMLTDDDVVEGEETADEATV